MERKNVSTFAAVNQNDINMRIEQLTKNEMAKILGGGYWVNLGNGKYIYIPSDDEEGDEDDIIFV